MENKNSRLKALIITGAVLVLVLALALIVPALRSGKTETNSSQTADQTVTAEQEGSENSSASADPLAVLFCVSDYQPEEGWGDPADNLRDLIASVADAGKKPTGVIISGDYTNDRNLHDYQLSPDQSIAEIRGIIRSEMPGWSENDADAPSDDAIIFEQGNHDALTDSISKSGLHEYDNYLIYVINTQNDFPWKQGKTSGCLKKVRAASAELDACFAKLVENGEKRPVIIAGHVPLHYTARTSSKHKTGDNLYASILFNAVNKYGKSLNIIYLYGHNHTKGWDCYLGGSSVYRAAGSSLLVPQFEESDLNSDKYTKETLNFTYLNAGYVGHYMNCGPVELDEGKAGEYAVGDVALTATVIEIYEDRIGISRWDFSGMHDLGSEGNRNPYKGGIDLSLIPHTEYSTRTASPQIITRY